MSFLTKKTAKFQTIEHEVFLEFRRFVTEQRTNQIRRSTDFPYVVHLDDIGSSVAQMELPNHLEQFRMLLTLAAYSHDFVEIVMKMHEIESPETNDASVLEKWRHAYLGSIKKQVSEAWKPMKALFDVDDVLLMCIYELTFPGSSSVERNIYLSGHYDHNIGWLIVKFFDKLSNVKDGDKWMSEKGHSYYAEYIIHALSLGQALVEKHNVVSETIETGLFLLNNRLKRCNEADIASIAIKYSVVL